jgi:peptidoglycan/LPS O-acetylase OafA/YrhL
MSNLVQKINNSAVMDGTYLPTLDGWRAIAIIIVIFAHSYDSISNILGKVGINFDYDCIKHAGLFGVQIFFGLSGLLITSRLIASENKYGRISLKSFYIRRTFRILPPALVFLVVIGILALFGIIPITLGRWTSSLLFFANYSTAKGTWYLGHFWSLAVEEHFYMIWPAVFLILKVTKKRVIFAITIALLLAFWRALDFKFHITGATPSMFWGRTDIQGDNILWGVVVALLYADSVWKARLNKFLKLPTILPSFIIFTISVAALPSPGWKLAFILLTIKAIVIPLMILATLINNSSILSYMLETPIFRLIGRLSYSIYLWQQLFLVWNKSSIQSFGILQSLPFNIIAVFACAILSFLFIEKPLIAIGHRIAIKVI